jgi:hypothetical protein
MLYFRLYFLSPRSGRIVRFAEFEAPDETAAVALAESRLTVSRWSFGAGIAGRNLRWREYDGSLGRRAVASGVRLPRYCRRRSRQADKGVAVRLIGRLTPSDTFKTRRRRPTRPGCSA